MSGTRWMVVMAAALLAACADVPGVTPCRSEYQVQAAPDLDEHPTVHCPDGDWGDGDWGDGRG